MDERFFEQAAALEQRQRDEALARRPVLAPESHPDFDGTHCVEDSCGDEIPAPRLAMGKVRCVACQTRLEKKR